MRQVNDWNYAILEKLQSEIGSKFIFQILLTFKFESEFSRIAHLFVYGFFVWNAFGWCVFFCCCFCVVVVSHNLVCSQLRIPCRHIDCLLIVSCSALSNVYMCCVWQIFLFFCFHNRALILPLSLPLTLLFNEIYCSNMAGVCAVFFPSQIRVVFWARTHYKRFRNFQMINGFGNSECRRLKSISCVTFVGALNVNAIAFVMTLFFLSIRIYVSFDWRLWFRNRCDLLSDMFEARDSPIQVHFLLHKQSPFSSQ